VARKKVKIIAAGHNRESEIKQHLEEREQRMERGGRRTKEVLSLKERCGIVHLCGGVMEIVRGLKLFTGLIRMGAEKISIDVGT